MIAGRQWQEEQDEKWEAMQQQQQEATARGNSKRQQQEATARGKQDAGDDDEHDSEVQPSAPYERETADRHAGINRLEASSEQREKLYALTLRSRIDPTSVTLKEWEDATEGTDVLEMNEEVARFVELARKRAG
ncbi:hypothetical protein N0V83_009144 [Neocucurbitaria cava]|uniref:Uncharacterized protein n=1 Tax=Neocucurbitaria cava TaxID=798079 RepID=A0A9W8Y0B3_9PLEO|nr:hypothetical protein N0V83_009144 [Neocucurbitaria cava]